MPCAVLLIGFLFPGAGMAEADVADRPYVLYSLTVPDCTRNDMIVFDLFFRDDKPVTMTELAPYL